MLMKKILFIFFVLLVTLTQAKYYNAIAIVVDGEPITTTEISAVQKQLGVSKKEAQGMLIENRLQKASMRDISVSEDEIDKRIKLIAEQNSMSIKKMQGILKQQKQSWNSFRDQTKLSIQKQKFFRSKIAKSIPDPSEDELKIFYRNHPELFSMPSSITVMEYSASSVVKIQKMLEDPYKQKGIKRKKVTFGGSDVTPQLLAMISQTAIGNFTPAFNNGHTYVTYKVLNKGKATRKPFNQVKKNVTIAWKKERQGKAVEDYFKKVKSNATIEYIRR
ncbi:MAG: peptidyl-prolyl cis-trans isomerase [Epsilonproteobacteria bacterium]|nr:MAG: peptidyl-prolyl cis-trans isomerase [Campylobacterota bacterium]